MSSVLNARDREVVRLVRERPGQRQVLLSDALERYLELHDNGTGALLPGAHEIAREPLKSGLLAQGAIGPTTLRVT